MFLRRNSNEYLRLFPLLLFFLTITVSSDLFAFSSNLSPAKMSEIQRNAGVEYVFKDVEAANPAQNWRIRFNNDSVTIAPSNTKNEKNLKLKLLRIGNDGHMHNLNPVKPLISGNRASYRRALVEEWYVNGPLGLEQGFNVPKTLGNGLVLELESSWSAERKGEGIQLAEGDNNWFFGALHAVDSKGKVLPSDMKVLNGKLRLEVDTQNAHFPVIIDPILTRKATLIASDQTAFLQFGRSVAISGDGNTAIVGTDKNAAYIYQRTTAGWSQVQKLVKPNSLRCNSNGPYFGWSVALSNDGSTIMVGASGIFPFDSNGIIIDLFLSCRDLPVYVKSGAKWVLQKILSPPNATVEDLFGSAIAISDDGSKAIIGAELTQCTTIADTCGAVYFYERGTNGWTNPRRIVSGLTYNAQEGFFGATTAISGDGLWALTGAPGGDSAWIFQRQAPPIGWKVAKKLQFPASRLAIEFGTALALSGNGGRAIVSAQSAGGIGDCRGDFSHCGAAYSFVRQGATWLFEKSFTAADSHDFNYFGQSLDLSADGKRVVVGTAEADCVNGNCGAAYLFDWNGTAWVQRGRVISPTSGQGGFLLGYQFGAALSMDWAGLNMLVSSREENCATGMGCGKVYSYSIAP